VFKTSLQEEREYLRKKDLWEKERYIKDCSTRVKVVKPQSLKSYHLLKKAELIILEANFNSEENRDSST